MGLLAGPAAFAADELHIKDHGVGVYEVTPDSAASGTKRDIHLSTGTEAILSVAFPNGMNWQLGSDARVWIHSFSYAGPIVKMKPVRVRWKKGALKDSLIASEQSASAWDARLEEGELYISGPMPDEKSEHVVSTPDVKIDLHAAAISISRDATAGTVVNVFNGTATFTLPDGRIERADEGTRLVITPAGEVLRGVINPGTWVWLPPPQNTRVNAVALFPPMPIDRLTVSPSS